MQRLMVIAAVLLVAPSSLHSQGVAVATAGSEVGAPWRRAASPLTAAVLNGGLLEFGHQSLLTTGQRGEAKVMSRAAAGKCRYFRAALLGFGIGFAVGLAAGYADQEWHITSDDPGSPWLLAAGAGAVGALVGLAVESGAAAGTNRCS